MAGRLVVHNDGRRKESVVPDSKASIPCKKKASLGVSDSTERRDLINDLLHEQVERLARYLYPQGKKIGASWRIGSMDINLRTGVWGDWDGSTDRMSRNLINLWIHANHSDFRTAIQDIERWLGVPESQWPARPGPGSQPKQAKKLVLPLLEKPTAAELNALSTQRSLSVQALHIAVQREFLWTYTDPFEKVRAWLLTDSTRKLAVGRRLDGQVWRAAWAKDAKSKSLHGSLGNWPIGIKEAAGYPAIGLVEGTPDFLALIAHAWGKGMQDHVAPVCLAGAQMSIPKAALPFFIGKRVRIFVHADDAGIAAASRWYSQLKKDARVDGYSFDGLTQIDGQPVTDLNDLCRIAPESKEAHRQEVESLLDLNIRRESN